MLTNLHVKNLALIEQAEVNFENGLNILTGETGAGKSIIIGSMNYALGAKVDREVIREGAEYALVELVFEVKRPELLRKIKELELPIEEDGTLILTRKIMPARTQFRVCGETVTARQVKELASLLIDIHGQHEHQSLLNPIRQREMLDRFAGGEVLALKEKLAARTVEFRKLEAEKKKISYDESARQRETALAAYEVNEIETAALKPGEDVELESRYRKMQNAQKIEAALQAALQVLGAGDTSAADQIGIGCRELACASGMDEGLVPYHERLADVESILTDFYHDLARYAEDFSFDAKAFDQTEKRMDQINSLMLKYGGSLEKVIAYKEERQKELDKLNHLDAYLAELDARMEAERKEIRKLCDAIHGIRKTVAAELSEKVTEILKDLNFLRVSFEIMVTETEEFTQEGADEVCFSISLNPGEKLKPVAEVASGGELSRIMLALKTVFADKDETGTLIFDEIDTGISGRTAWKVAERMADISRTHQVICITHLPQIAAMADTHFMIEKKEQQGKTITQIYPLEEDGMQQEVARLLGTDDISEAVLLNAKELRTRAVETKTKRR